MRGYIAPKGWRGLLTRYRYMRDFIIPDLKLAIDKIGETDGRDRKR